MWKPICIVSSAAWNWQAKCWLCLSVQKFLWTSMPVLFVYNVTSALYCAINNHFCVVRVSLVATSRLACGWMCDSPGTGCACRLTPTCMWREYVKAKAHIYVKHVNFWEIIIPFPNGGQWAPFSKACPPWLKLLVTPLLTASKLLLTCVNNLGAIPKCVQVCRLDSCIHHWALLFSHTS